MADNKPQRNRGPQASLEKAGLHRSLAGSVPDNGCWGMERGIEGSRSAKRSEDRLRRMSLFQALSNADLDQWELRVSNYAWEDRNHFNAVIFCCSAFFVQ